jgi:hypothetical protein
VSAFDLGRLQDMTNQFLETEGGFSRRFLAAGVTVRPDPRSKGLGVFATAPLPAGTWLGTFTGDPSPVRSRMSLQFGPDLFIEPDPLEPLRNLNHACEPTAGFVGRDLFARRALEAGEPVTIDYNLHEPELAIPFACACGSQGCVGEVQGWRFLGAEEKALRRPSAGAWLAD